MAMTLDELQGLLDKEGIKYFLAPGQPVLMAGFAGMFGHYQVLIKLEVDGTFLQFRTLGYLNCEAGHESLDEVLKVIGELNFKTRLMKLGWDPSDGEIVAYADIWLVDAKLTLEQLKRMIGNFMPAIDIAHKRIKETIETGRDPGEVDPKVMFEEVLKKKGSGLPPAVQKLLKKMGKGGDEDGEEERGKVKTL
ncbi:MAG: YbjN domain-containing protein [Acidimicrobiia bacterium]